MDPDWLIDLVYLSFNVYLNPSRVEGSLTVREDDCMTLNNFAPNKLIFLF